MNSQVPCASALGRQRASRSRRLLRRAVLVRLLHHSTTINIRGESYPLKDRSKTGLVSPRSQEGAEVAAHSLGSDSVTRKTRQKTALGSTPSEPKGGPSMRFRTGDEFPAGIDNVRAFHPGNSRIGEPTKLKVYFPFAQAVPHPTPNASTKNNCSRCGHR